MSSSKKKYSVGIGSFVKVSDGEFGFVKDSRMTGTSLEYKNFYTLTKKTGWVGSENVSLLSITSPQRRSKKRKASTTTTKTVSPRKVLASDMTVEECASEYKDFLAPAKCNGISSFQKKMAAGIKKKPGWWRKSRFWNKREKGALPKHLNEQDKLTLHTEFCLLLGVRLGVNNPRRGSDCNIANLAHAWGVSRNYPRRLFNVTMTRMTLGRPER